MPLRMLRALVLITLVLALGAAAPVAGKGGSDDLRARGTCGAGADAELRLRDRGGSIRVRFDVDGRRAGERWRVVLVHERRVAWRGSARTSSSSASFSIRRSVPDYDGADQVAARASGPGGNTCEATGVLQGS
jgi:hypothetical protein